MTNIFNATLSFVASLTGQTAAHEGGNWVKFACNICVA